MSTVKIPPVLRQAVGGERTVDAPGATVGEVLTNLCEAHPAVGAQILTADGRRVTGGVRSGDERSLHDLGRGIDRGADG